MRFVPQYLSEENLSHLHGLILRSTSIVLLISIAVAGAGWVILGVAGSWMPEYYVIPAQLAFLCVPFLTLISLISGVSRGFGWVGMAYVPQSVALPGLVLLAVWVFTLVVGQPNAVMVLTIALVICGLIALAHAARFRRVIPDDVRASKPTYTTKFWLRVAIPLFLSDGLFLILWNADIIMLGTMMGPEATSVYHASVRTDGLTLMIFNAMMARSPHRNFPPCW